MEYIVDRLEETLAVCETESREMISISLDLLPSDVKEGDILMEKEGVFTVDAGATSKRRERIRKKMTDLFGP